jgi:hypothetical protein
MQKIGHWTQRQRAEGKLLWLPEIHKESKTLRGARGGIVIRSPRKKRSKTRLKATEALTGAKEL